ncbi:MAG: aldo/keto reductase [Alphaproteobacteria bacterium]|nr:aldo/keto reductase [Alphaproteobacteria bacterium]
MRQRLLGHTGLRVSELCLGTMTFGEDWGWGAEAAECGRIFDRFVEAGGTFFDCADAYVGGKSERILGDLIKRDRHLFVVGTKYGTATANDFARSGSSRKTLTQALDASLKRLDTDYIDVYWLHFADGHTPMEEIMRALDDAVRIGKILYIGLSNTPAWWAARADLLAELRGWTRVAALQVDCSLVERTAERELLPMARALDIGVLGFAPMGGGVLSGKYLAPLTGPSRQPGAGAFSQLKLQIAATVAAHAQTLMCSPAQLALAWVLKHYSGGVIPIVGARSEDQILDNIGCLSVDIPEPVAQHLAQITAPSLGFPHELLNSDLVRNLATGWQHDRFTPHRPRLV